MFTRGNKRIRDYFNLPDDESSSSSSITEGGGLKKYIYLTLFNIYTEYLILTHVIYIINHKGTNEDAPMEEPPTKKQRSIPRLLDGRYYTIVTDLDGKIEAKCITCDELRKGNIKSTGNFLNHYRTKHLSLVVEIEKYINRTNEKDTSVQPAVVSLVGPAISKDDVS